MARKYHSSWWLLRAALALILAFIVGAAVSCAHSNSSTADPNTDNPPAAASDKPVNGSPDDNGSGTAVDQGSQSTTGQGAGSNEGSVVTVGGGTDIGTGTGSNPGGSTGEDKDPVTSSGGITDTDSGTGGASKPTTGSDSGSTATPTKPNHTPSKPVSSNTSGSKEPVIVAKNEAFRIYAPAEDAVVGTTFKVTGEARVFEAAFSYSFEDGHNVLVEGHVMADQGAPEWGKFEFEVTFKEATSPFGILVIYENSAKDGSRIHQLEIPVQFADGIVKPVSGEE
ncbi:immunoglobulin-like protein involved in spore germination [Paenibacillus cellulosilyticus]|uniref:Immunoglobulin-like protein involved in spore germination n=1 Tax=Paenibacillus cellulosilyticus TaxID=375489 RepID=A0A2V2Z8V2_9BACL|nr:Gmad2 immunoglobulin-like domain-containing protein [Paenibacillus cellulosilyticus]PWW08551.1 immunoglobulin-like protein involved in spore germination [Paenibacillus cellulosilyticus]QKS48126.1 hypothetical protein HUB94_27990 [Paenibacillus cellulosilyticus]